MGLYKPIRQNDGVVTNYHRILYLTKTTNEQNSIAILSYVDEEARVSEQTYAGYSPYHKSVVYETLYDENMTIESAYNYLKTLPVFEGSTDV